VHLSHLRARLCAVGILASLVAACGARTGIPDADAGPKAPECIEPADCPGFEDRCHPLACLSGQCVAQAAIDCDDRDPCTDDACTTTTGACTHAQKTPDVDHDGHRAPLPGYVAGAPGSCGDDCDDTSANAFPGNKEICDGVDNDCNGIVDDGAHYVPDPTHDAVRVSEGASTGGRGGLAYAKSSYFSTFYDSVATKDHTFEKTLARDGTGLGGQQLLPKVVADAFAGKVVWTGDGFGVTWEDRRTASWEVYFSRLNADGQKLAADIPVSDDDSQWSLNDALVWTGTEFVIAWQDQRDFSQQWSVFAQRLDPDGKPLGGNVQLVTEESESPSLAVGRSGLGLTWTHVHGTSKEIWFQTFDRAFAPTSQPTRVTAPGASGVYSTIVWSQDRYVIAWDDRDGARKAIYAATYDEAAQPLIAAKIVTDSPRFSRTPTILPLGDRVQLVFADDKDQNVGYELYAKQLSRDLVPLEAELRLTFAKGDSVDPLAAFGPNGDIGVLFDDYRDGYSHVYFARLGCATSAP
jgi:hypothetical protein